MKNNNRLKKIVTAIVTVLIIINYVMYLFSIGPYKENIKPEGILETVEENTEPKEPLEAVEENTEPKEPLEVVEENIEPKEPLEAVEENTEPKEPLEAVEENTEPKEPLEAVEENTESKETLEVDKENAAAEVSIALYFKNDKLKQDHYKKHGIEMGFSSADEYEKAAAAVVMNPDALHKTEAEDGDDVYYLEDTNEFVIVSTSGFIRTYFNPSAGINYYNRQ